VRIVIDASVAAEYLLRTPLGTLATPLVDGARLFAPELLDAEVLAVVRKAVLSGRLEESRAIEVLTDLLDWDVERIPHRALVRDAWTFRHNVSAYDALYLAAARLCEAVVLTADGPLSRSPDQGVEIRNVGLK
jgi:predicted nucleic acid-binding protein